MAKLRYTHPNSFANALKMQNQIMHDTYVLPLLHITVAELFYLQPILEQITGVIAVVPTRTTSQTGRYNILITSGHFKATKAIITKQKKTNIFNTAASFTRITENGRPAHLAHSLSKRGELAMLHNCRNLQGGGSRAKRHLSKEPERLPPLLWWDLMK
jgi:hypothetical protein